MFYWKRDTTALERILKHIASAPPVWVTEPVQREHVLPENSMYTRPGLPRDLEQETYAALRAIYLKYRNMRKIHMNPDRIVAIMGTALKEATNRDDTSSQPSSTSN